jgi:hypothetical protein
MGRRDFRRRESKKPKKGAKKLSVTDILSPSETVEVIKRGKKKQEE